MSLARSRPHPERADRSGNRQRPVLPAAAPSPAGAAVPRLQGRRPARDRARCGGELLRSALGRDRSRRAGAGSFGRPRGGNGRGGLVRSPINRHRAWQLAVDACLIVAAWYLAFRLRFDPRIPPPYERLFSRTVLIVLAIQLVVFVLFGFYNRWWRYVSTRDMWGAARGVSVACLVSSVTVYFLHPVRGFPLPRSVAIMDWLLLLAFVAGSRLLARTLIERPAPRELMARGKEVIVVGAGDAAQLMVKEMLRSAALGYTPIGLIDDDPRKRNLRLHGVRVLGTTEELSHILSDQRPDEVLIAIPSASGEVRQRIVDVARRAQVPVKTLPGLNELISGELSLAGQIRPVQVEDVLGREPVEIDLPAVASYLSNETVLVTGAGGSIGSELCRQVARIGCKRLILVEQAETPLFEIERELVSERGFSPCVPVLADVGNRRKLQQVFDRYRPSVVFHAAAYKHVPLMEANPLESVRNNTLATMAVADVSAEFGVGRFVLVSTDKAVNPRTVMGQSKALCEWIVEAYGHRQDVKTRFVAVRFGNVLGSSGSVIPIFRRQIGRGGPVTITHPEMTRFFMTIPEAVSLIVQAGSIGGRGEIFVLDMGEPVSIVELARNMILLSGRDPDRDVSIEYVGVRPGEKLHEELWSSDESVTSTQHSKIMLVTRPAIDGVWLEEELAELERLVEAGETLDLVARLGGMMRDRRLEGVATPVESERSLPLEG
ncbi:MAG: polysaccharide biosynthesis protein [Candidatus Rokuibacteriota bacterium]|nr:MAG: polysaccharide biosynthesis protein [Candidatus Rokubacteria bacterium]